MDFTEFYLLLFCLRTIYRSGHAEPFSRTEAALLDPEDKNAALEAQVEALRRQEAEESSPGRRSAAFLPPKTPSVLTEITGRTVMNHVSEKKRNTQPFSERIWWKTGDEKTALSNRKPRVILSEFAHPMDRFCFGNGCL